MANKMMNFAEKGFLSYSLICREILRHGTGDLPSPPMEVVLRIFIALKHPIVLGWV
jgi:hypothetical protein